MLVHASISENGNAGWDGKAKTGDQTGREVCTRSFYKKPWNVMLRYKDSSIASKASKIAIKLAKSNLVGYDQSERNTLYNMLKKHKWDVDAYIASGKKTETDCSAFIYACYCCLIPSMRSDANAPTTSTMRSKFSDHGFSVHTASKYTDSDAYLKPGDVLIREGHHTAMNTSTGSKATVSHIKKKKTTSTPNKTTKWIGKVTASALNVRTGAGTGYSNIKRYPLIYKGEKIKVCDALKDKKGNTWYYVKIKDTVYGFVSADYIRKA